MPADQQKAQKKDAKDAKARERGLAKERGENVGLVLPFLVKKVPGAHHYISMSSKSGPPSLCSALHPFLEIPDNEAGFSSALTTCL